MYLDDTTTHPTSMYGFGPVGYDLVEPNGGLVKRKIAIRQ